MKSIHCMNIVVPPERQRKEFANIQQLAESFTRNGQIHAIVLEADGVTLRAGERRLRAMQHLLSVNQAVGIKHDGDTLPDGHIAFTLLHELDEAGLYEIELEENLQRENLSWQEKVAALDKLYQLHKMRAEVQGKEMTVVDFVRAVKDPEATSSDSLNQRTAVSVALAKHLTDPDVAKAKTQKEALNIVKRKQSSIIEQELAARIVAENLNGNVSKHKLHHGDSFELAKTLPSGFYDIIITDPPYGIDMDQMNTQSGSASGLTHDYKDDFEYASSCVSLVASEGFRVTKASAVCYMFCDFRYFHNWAHIFALHGWYVWPNPIIWNKTPTGSLLGAANGPRHCYEVVLMAIKGSKGVNIVGSDVVSIPGPSHDKLHPAEKPVELYMQFLSWSAAPGDQIVDFFAGCGNVFPAATQCACYATGIERSDTHAATAINNLNKMVLL